MKKTLLSKKNPNKLFTLLVFCCCFNFGWSQQVIGEFPIMDGGLENQTAGNMKSQGSSAKGTASTTWSISSTGGTTNEKILDTPVDARTGNFSAQAQLNNDKDNARLQTPSTVSPNALSVSTSYTIQFFYKSPTALDDGDLKPGIYLNNTSSGKTKDKTDASTFAANTWTKAHGKVTTGGDFDASNWAVARIGGVKGVDKPLISFDDFVVYAGDYDDTAPDIATGGSYVNNGGTGTISWLAPAGGVDGGGYVVVKYTTDPNADNDPNQNGIYNVGNTTTNGTGSLTGTVVYIGTDTSFMETHVAGTFYKIYTVDKAFNYSDELKVSSSTTASVDEVFASKVSVYPNPAKDFVTISSPLEINKLEVYNLLGKRVISSSKLINNNLDISTLAKGIYMMKLTSGESVASKKLIKR
ncbi:T9SS type A sorting domain-containing protein [Polaribacter haliotis]|uniref:T9SS type A sorting domain-containing protein n=1 Tax=Polaribacter haliotis TaxID=1888915 RepID=A0A7L8AG27_9FLAO|nr:T9SS type A sorting domain-containing protein [Polaribacter haliotis]QOD60968.1 T9SS type A sorting domain-containing protein [Polaribacter haliotis]